MMLTNHLGHDYKLFDRSEKQSTFLCVLEICVCVCGVGGKVVFHQALLKFEIFLPQSLTC